MSSFLIRVLGWEVCDHISALYLIEPNLRSLLSGWGKWAKKWFALVNLSWLIWKIYKFPAVVLASKIGLSKWWTLRQVIVECKSIKWYNFLNPFPNEH